jgi:hypothetical protein
MGPHVVDVSQPPTPAQSFNYNARTKSVGADISFPEGLVTGTKVRRRFSYFKKCILHFCIYCWVDGVNIKAGSFSSSSSA